MSLSAFARTLARVRSVLHQLCEGRYPFAAPRAVTHDDSLRAGIYPTPRELSYWEMLLR